MDVPQTVSTALADRPVEGATCLEAGAGVGNTTAGLLEAGADRVVAVTNDREHAATVRERIALEYPERTAVVEADVRALPVETNAVDIVTAHGLFNVLAPASLPAVAAEFTRVAAPGCHLVVDDYDPLPDDSAVSRLFAVENAASSLARERPALTFYPAAVLRGCFESAGWTCERERTLLDPVPWTASHLAAHAAEVRSDADRLPAALADPLVDEAERLADEIGSESTGRMYSVAMYLSGDAAP